MPSPETVRSFGMGFGKRRVMRELHLAGCNAVEIGEWLGVKAEYVRWSIRLLPPPRTARMYQRQTRENEAVRINFKPNGRRL